MAISGGDDLEQPLAISPEDKKLVDAIVDIHIKILSTAYDKAAAYTNLIIVAGYAIFFGLWQLTRGFVEKRLAILAALSMMVSVFFFVIFEVWKGYLNSRTVHGMNAALFQSENRSPADLLAEVERTSSADRKRAVRLYRFWPWFLGATVFFGLCAESILAWALVTGLVREL